MLNGIWCGMMVLSLFFGAFGGRLDAVMQAGMEAAGEAVGMSVRLLGVLCLWCGVMRILEQAGGVAVIARLFSPMLRILFPRLAPNSSAMQAIVMNLSANLLGISNAATPLGLRAMQELQKNNCYPDRATDEMCTFVVLNTASIQLVPTSLIALRQAAGSQAPFAIVFPVLLVSMMALTIGVVAVKAGNRRW